MMIWVVSDYAHVPTPEQSAASQALIEACYESAKRHGWSDIEKGYESGFTKPHHDPIHYRNDAFMLDDRVLDPDRPENLMYYKLPNGKMALAGFMFLAEKRSLPGPQIGGPLTVWHYHTWARKQCLIDDAIPAGWANDGECETGFGSHRSSEMMHVWLVDHPGGPFATSMMMNNPERLPQLLAKRMKEHGF